MNPRRHFWFACAYLAGIALVASRAEAATYCAASVAELQNALSAAAATIDYDEVRLVRGTYANPGPFIYGSANAGWSPQAACEPPYWRLAACRGRAMDGERRCRRDADDWSRDGSSRTT